MKNDSLTIRRATLGDLDLLINNLMPQSFSDPTDLDDPEDILAYHKVGLAVSHLISLGDETIGFTLNRVHPMLQFDGYCPYMGINPEFRNQGYGTRAFKMIKADLGVDIHFDFEDPDRMEGVYPDMPLDQVIANCLRRFRFWERSGCVIVRDKRIPYCRFASDAPLEIQAYDCYAVCPLDPAAPKWQQALVSRGKPAMRLWAMREGFLKIFQLEGKDPKRLAAERELRDRYPAVDDFLRRLDGRVRHRQALAYLNVSN